MTREAVRLGTEPAPRHRSAGSSERSARQRIELPVGIGLAALTVGAALLRWPTLAGDSLWFDEWITRRIVSGSPLDVLRGVKGTESTPPLYYLVAWVWAKAFGTSETALRSLSLVFGALTVPVAYSTGSTLVSRRAGWVAAALVTTSPLLVWYSTEARAYALLVLLGAVSLLLVSRALTSPTPRVLGLWSLTAILALATHYFSAFLVVAEAAVLLVCIPSRRRAIGLYCVPIALSAALLAPLAYVQRNRGSWIDQYPLSGRLEEVGRNFVSGVSISSAGLELLGAVLVAAAALLAFRGSTRERRGALVALAAGALSLGLAVGLALAGRDYLITRNVIASWLPLALVVAIGAASARHGPLGGLLAASLVAVSLANVALVASDERLQRASWKQAARLLGEPSRDRLVLAWGDYRLAPLEELLQPARQLEEGAVVEVAEIDALLFDRPSFTLSCWSGAACNVPAARLPDGPPAAGFSLGEHRNAGLFDVHVFRAPVARRVQVGRLLQRFAEVVGTPRVYHQVP